jgi:hypothetical protein
VTLLGILLHSVQTPRPSLAPRHLDLLCGLVRLGVDHDQRLIIAAHVAIHMTPQALVGPTVKLGISLTLQAKNAAMNLLIAQVPPSAVRVSHNLLQLNLPSAAVSGTTQSILSTQLVSTTVMYGHPGRLTVIM